MPKRKLKCKKNKHAFEEEKRKCICGKADVWWYSCARCQVLNLAKVQGMVCDECLSDKAYQREIAEQIKKSSLGVKRYKDAVAFGIDKATGQPHAIDKKGRRFDPDKTRYDFARDPHGWEKTGKKVRKTDEFGNPNR